MPTFYNQATLTYNNTSTSSNIVQGEYVGALTASKTSLSGQYQPGDNVTFAVSLVNSGDAAYEDLCLTDNLGAYSFGCDMLTPLDYVEGSLHYYVNGVLQDAPDVSAGPPLYFSGLNLPANSNVLLVYSAHVNGYAPLGRSGSIVNTATIEGACLNAAIIAQDRLPAACGLQLSISKAICPSTVVENQPITYTLTILNNSCTAAVATDEVVVRDVFSPALDISSVRFNGAQWYENQQYEYDPDTGVFATLPTFITVPAASFTQNSQTGAWTITPGISTLSITGTLM